MNGTSLWAVHCLDAPDAEQLRVRLRPQHSHWLRSGEPVPLLYGPLTADDGERPTGSLMIVSAPDRETVERHFSQDPFRTGGVWQEVRIDAFAPSERSPVRFPPSPEGSRPAP